MDAFQYFDGAVVIVAVRACAGAGHPDLLQGKHVDGAYWKHVYCGAPGKPLPMMGLRAWGMINATFEDVRWYGSVYESAIDFRFNGAAGDTRGTTFKGCVWWTAKPNGPAFFGIDKGRVQQ